MKKVLLLVFLIIILGCKNELEKINSIENRIEKELNLSNAKVSGGGDLYCKQVETDWYTLGCSNNDCYFSYDYTTTSTQCYYSRPNPSYSGGYGGGDIGHGGWSNNYPALQNGGLVNKIKGTSSLTSIETNALNEALEDYITNCLNNTIFKGLLAKNFKINFSMNTNASNPSFNPNNNTITFNSIGSMSGDPMAEEFFHAFQDSYYDGGTSQYLSVGASNIEFEAKLYHDLRVAVSNEPAQFYGEVGTYATEYRQWIYDLTNWGSKFPSTIPIDKYLKYLNNFRTYWNSGGNSLYGSPIKSDLYPDALMNLINSSNCSR